MADVDVLVEIVKAKARAKLIKRAFLALIAWQLLK